MYSVIVFLLYVSIVLFVSCVSCLFLNVIRFGVVAFASSFLRFVVARVVVFGNFFFVDDDVFVVNVCVCLCVFVFVVVVLCVFLCVVVVDCVVLFVVIVMSVFVVFVCV